MSRLLRLSLVALLPGCQQLTRIDGGEQACVPPAVQAAFERSCARGGCHDANGSGGGLALTAGRSATVIDGASSQQAVPLVVIGDPKGSYMAHKLMDAPPTPIIGVRMPVAFDPENPEQTADVSTILAWIAGAPIAGCEAEAASSDEGVADTGGSSDGTSADSSGGDIEARGLPCEIDDVLERRCRSCHSDPPVGAPMPLVTREHLLAATPSNAALSAGERALERMMDDAAPMPPAPGTRVPADELAIFQAWIDAGSPADACGAGGSESGEPEPEPDPFDVDPVCTSQQYWDDDDDGDPRMRPGRDCVSCHTEESDDDDVPDLVIAGTVYPTAHEPNDCKGASSVDLRVVVQSMTSGDEVALTPNSSGNFLLHRGDAPSGFAPPYQVKVVDGERERIMPIPAPAGSCNGCHTQAGTMGAPGRVVAP